jgi:hypothetical protein
MATRQFNLTTLSVVLGCALLLPVACGSDDDSGNPTPPGTGGSGAKGGGGGKGGNGGKGGGAGVGEEGGATTGGTTSNGGKGGSSATGGKGGSSKGGSSNGTGGNAGMAGEAGTAGGHEMGTGGTGGSGPAGHDCTDADEVTYNCSSAAHPVNIKCYSKCNPTKTDDSEFFLNMCPDEPVTFGGVTAACQPWTTELTKLGAGCTAESTDCPLPPLPN